MGKNSDLLKDAIADAKAVRETALANARMRMEEAFTPRLQSMISAKLQNEVEGEGEEEDMIDEPEVAPEVDAEMPVEEPVEAPIEEPVDAEMPVEEPVEAPIEEPVAVDAEPGSEVDIEVEPEVAPEDEVEEEGYELDLESIIKELDLEADVDDVDMEEPSFEDDNVFESSDEDDEEKEELEEGDNTEAGLKTKKDVTPNLTASAPNAGGGNQTSPDRGKPFSSEKGGEHSVSKDLNQMSKNAIYEDEGEEFEVDDEEINLDEILRELEEADLSASIPDPLEDSASNPFKSMNEQLSTKVSRLSKDLKEHRQVIKFLKSKLNEVNLLNAKLLFTSKLFKSNNLTNSQKMKVIESFDRAKSLREVKLVYSTIAESFGNTKSEPTVKKSVKSITEQISGGASKVVASTKPNAKIISEAIVSEEGAARLRKLAFGGKKKK